MSERSQTVPTPEGEYLEGSRLTGLSFVLGLIALVALVLSAVGAFVNPHQLSYSWLFAFAFSSPCALAAFFGQSSIMPPRPNGRWWCGVSWKILRHCCWSWHFFSCQSFSFGTIFIHGWTFRPGTSLRWIPSALISI